MTKVTLFAQIIQTPDYFSFIRLVIVGKIKTKPVMLIPKAFGSSLRCVASQGDAFGRRIS